MKNEPTVNRYRFRINTSKTKEIITFHRHYGIGIFGQDPGIQDPGIEIPLAMAICPAQCSE